MPSLIEEADIAWAKHQCNLNLALWTTLTSGPFAANLDTWDPPEHHQKIPFGSNSHLRHNIKIYLRLNSTVSL